MVSPEFSLAALSRCPDISQRVPGPTRVVSSLPASQLLANSSPLTPDNNSLGEKKGKKMDFPLSLFRNSGKISKCSAATQSGERCPALPRARLPDLERL